jgi:hypothetical protein
LRKHLEIEKRNRQWVEVGAVLDHGHPEVVDADLADYFGSIPHSELLKSAARDISGDRIVVVFRAVLVRPQWKPLPES